MLRMPANKDLSTLHRTLPPTIPLISLNEVVLPQLAHSRHRSLSILPLVTQLTTQCLKEPLLTLTTLSVSREIRTSQRRWNNRTNCNFTARIQLAVSLLNLRRESNVRRRLNRGDSVGSRWLFSSKWARYRMYRTMVDLYQVQVCASIRVLGMRQKLHYLVMVNYRTCSTAKGPKLSRTSRI